MGRKKRGKGWWVGEEKKNQDSSSVKSKIIERVIILSGSDILILGIVLWRSGESPSSPNWFIYGHWAMLWKGGWRRRGWNERYMQEREREREFCIWIKKVNYKRPPLPSVAPIFASNAPKPSPSSTCSWSPICNEIDKHPFPYLCTNTTSWYTNGDRLFWHE